MKCTLKWQGGLHLFKDVSPELFQRIPSRGKYVRFQLGVTTYTERGDGGRQVQHQLPVLLSIQPEELSAVLQPKPPQGDSSQAKTRSA